MRATPATFAGFGGGLNTRDAPQDLKPNQTANCFNVVSTPDGMLTKRRGLFQATTVGTAPQSIHGVNGVGQVKLLAISTTAMYAIQPGPPPVVTTVTGGGFNGTTPYCVVSAVASSGQGPIYMTHGYGAPQAWTGGSATAAVTMTATSGTLPWGAYAIYVNNRMWMANMKIAGYTPSGGSPVSDPGSTIAFSAINDPRAWPAVNTIQLDPGDGDEITGMGTIGPYILVFKKYKTYVIYDLDTGANRRVSTTTGCAAHRTIAETPRGTMFLTPNRGLYITDGSSVTPLGNQIQSFFPNSAQSATAVGTYYRDRYYLSFGGTTTLDYDMLLDSWWYHTYGANSYTEATFPNNNNVSQREYLFTVTGSSTTINFVDIGTVAAAYRYTDNLATFNSGWDSAWLSPGGPEVRKRLRSIRMTGFSEGNLNVGINKDFNSALVVPYSALTTGINGTFGQARVPGRGLGRAFQISFYDGPTGASGSAWSVRDFSFQMQGRKD